MTPSFFTDAVRTVEGFTSVRIDDKDSEYDNELTRFRFDAVLYKGTQQKPHSVRTFDVSQKDISDEAVLEMISAGEEVCLTGMRNGFISRQYEEYCNVFGKSITGLSSLRVSYPYRWYKLATNNGMDCLCFTDRDSRMTVRLGKDLRTDITGAKVIDVRSGEYTNTPYKENVYEGVSEEIRKYISRFLPDYMIPSTITVLEDLPRLDNGKTDRRALTAMVQTSAGDDEKVSTDDVVKYTEHLWKKMLRTDRTEYDTSFFMLGGHSLIAMQLLNNIKTDLRINVRLSEFMKQPTLRNLIDTIQTGISGNSFVTGKNEDESYDENAPFELTDLQQSYYVGRQSGMKLGGMPTHVYTELICSDYDHAKLTETFNILIKRHDILRCVFDENGMQRVLPEASICEIPYEDISSLPEAEREAYLTKKRHDINFQILDMTKAPLIGVYVTKYSEDRHIISIYFDSMIIDGWSFNNLIYEIDLIYREGAGSLPVLKNSFRKYMAHRSNIYSDEEKKAASAYWDEKIKTFSGPPELPVKTDPHSLEKISYHRESRRISEEVWDKLRAKANAEGLSPFVVLLTAYCRTLSYYSSSDEFLVNIPVSTRAASGLDLDDVAGDFSDFMIVNVKDPKNESFFDTASRIRDELYEMQENMAVTGTDVVRRINRMNGGTNGLLAPVVFTSIAETGRPDNKTLLCDYFESHTNLIWIDFVVTKCTGFVSISIDYVEQLFEDYLMNRIADTYLDMIEEFVEDSDSWKNVTHITLCDSDREIISSVNDAVYIPPEISYAEMVRCSIAAYGKKTAVYTDAEDYSYEKFFGMVSAFAERFTGTGKRVAVLSGKGIKLFVAAAAAVLSGNVYVPLDYDYPEEVMKACLDNLSPEYIAADSKWAEKASQFSDAEIIDLDKEEFSVHSPEQIHFTDKKPEDIFCILHTSGSTGKPKGIELREESLLACFTASENIFGIDENDCILALTNHCHDMSLFDIFAMYTYGAAVCVIGQEKWKDPTAWGEAILAHNVTMWNSVPSFMQILLDISGDRAGEIIGRLKTIIHGGEKFEPSEAEKLSRLNPGCVLFNVGGPSETTIWNITHRITQKDIDRGDIPYGKPIPGSAYYILDSTLQPVPVGVEGNMFIGGIGVSGGYINAAESNKNFIRTEDKGVIFNCGDRGFVGMDGEIYFRGRKDDQVKINGKRIELDGINSAALTVGGVSDSSVLFVKEMLRIILFYVSDTLDPDDIKNALREKLPDHMIPSACIKVEKIPYTHAGKPDKNTLRRIFDEYEASRPEAAKEYDTDEKFMEICRKCLDDENIMPSDNFFAVGGNSVTAIKLLACIRQTYGAELGFDSVFTAPVFGELYEKVKNSTSAGNSGANEEQTDNSGRYPLSFSQEGVWFDKLMGEDLKNVIGLILSLTGEVDIDRLETALDHAIKHFSMIRTAVRTDEDHRPYQTICPPEDFELDYDDISEEEDRDELLREYYDSYAHSDDVFDFENGKLYRFVLLRTGEKEYQLLCAFHHIICDDISIKVFTKYIENEYYGISGDEAEDNNFLAHALSERKITGDDIEKLGTDISKLRLIELPGRVSGSGYERHSVRFTGETAQKIAEYCTAHSITESIFMLAVYARTLSRLTNEKVIPIGFPVSKREASKQDTFGMYINMSVVIADCTGSFTDTAECVRDNIFKELSTEMVTFNKIAEYYGLSHDIRKLPFRFTYNYLFENKTDKRIKESIFNGFEYLVTNGHDDAGLLIQHEKDTITAEFSTVGYIDRAYLEKIGEVYREIAESVIEG
ncbi:MAG: AMP-binding protein [Ruminococcus sp.]|nr:AMP-binding protein [Ruminococcus sp.]